MAIDHSLTYKKITLKNIPHLIRLRDIDRAVVKLGLPKNSTYADFGCSNGYITNRIWERIQPKQSFGFDHNSTNIALAIQKYAQITFECLDLNVSNERNLRFDFVTCFETLEHVGDAEEAINNVIKSIAPGGCGLLTVPIECGFLGLTKFIAKRYVFRYSLEELPPSSRSTLKYIKALITNDRMSKFRDAREGWGTHFGFDFRGIDDALIRQGISYKAWNKGFTRFFLIRR